MGLCRDIIVKDLWFKPLIECVTDLTYITNLSVEWHDWPTRILMPLHVYILPKYVLDVTILFIALKRFAVNRFHEVNYEDASVAHDRPS